jgi:hypothetical protein
MRFTLSQAARTFDKLGQFFTDSSAFFVSITAGVRHALWRLLFSMLFTPLRSSPAAPHSRDDLATSLCE